MQNNKYLSFINNFILFYENLTIPLKRPHPQYRDRDRDRGGVDETKFYKNIQLRLS